MNTKILVGGHALRNLGSSRHTEDMDFLVYDENSKEIFIKDEENNIDYLNAASFSFFNEIFKKEIKENEGKAIFTASLDSLLELKCYALIQHLLNGKWAKATDCEFDIAFLVRKGANFPSIVKKYVSASEWAEIEKEVKSVKK